MLPLIAGVTLAGCAPEPESSQKPRPRSEPVPRPPEPEAEAAPERILLLASLAKTDHVAVVDPALSGEQAVRRVRVGAAPWGVGVDAARSVGYAATSEGLAIIDLDALRRRRLVAYRHATRRRERGEYRAGGLGLAVAPDGARVYVAVTDGDGAYFLEVYDVERERFTASVPVGLRPFDVVVDPEGGWVATIDHDAFTVTVVDTETLKPVAHRVAPFGTTGGLASWEKPHYAAVDDDGTILLPYQGRLVARLDPRSGRFTTLKSRANSHAHGTARAGRRLLTVGTGAFGNASGAPNLSILDLDTGRERVVPLDRPHETVAVWSDADGGEFAAVAGGNTRDEGWNGLTLVNLDDRSTRRIAVPGYPQALVAYTAARATIEA